MADSRQCRQRLSAMSVVILQPVLALSSAFPQQFHIFFDVSFLLFFGLLIFLGFLCYCCRFRLEISISAFSPPSDATNDMLKWPKRFILRILFRLFLSAFPFLHYFCLSCCLFCFTFRCGCHCNFLISRFSSFRHLFRLFSGAFAGN